MSSTVAKCFGRNKGEVSSSLSGKVLWSVTTSLSKNSILQLFNSTMRMSSLSVSLFMMASRRFPLFYCMNTAPDDDSASERGDSSKDR